MNVRKSLAWSFAQQATQFALYAAGSVIIAHLLTPAEVGVFALAMSLSSLLGALPATGISLYLVREHDLDQTKIRSAFGLMLVASCLLGLVLLVLSEPMAQLYGTPGMAPTLSLLSITFFLAPFGMPALSLLTREMRFDLLYRIGLLGSLVGTATSVTLALLGFSYYALACGLIASTLVVNLHALIHKPQLLGLWPSLARWREVLRFGGPISAANLAGAAADQGTRFVLGALQTPAAVALYERALTVSFMFRQALSEPLARVQRPAHAEAMRTGRLITAAILRTVGATTAIVWPLFAVIGPLSVSVVVTVFGENWRAAGEILPFVLFAEGLFAALPQPGVVLIPAGHVVRLLVLRLFHLLIAFTVAVIGASVSLQFFARLLPLGAFLVVVVGYLAIRRACGLSMRRLAPLYAQALLLATVAALPAVVVRLAYSDYVPLGGLAAVFVVAPSIWLAALVLLRHDLVGEARAFLGIIKAR